jgi:hypothetical protein
MGHLGGTRSLLRSRGVYYGYGAEQHSELVFAMYNDVFIRVQAVPYLAAIADVLHSRNHTMARRP